MERKSWSGKDWAILVLALAVVGLGFVVAADHLGAGEWWARATGKRVKVFDVLVDRENREFVDILFDRPIAEGKEGEALAEAPATISPALGGVWRWRDATALRFEPSGGLSMATEYKISLLPDRFLAKGFAFSGSPKVSFQTDQFLVEGATTFEEPAVGVAGSSVILRGEVRFNYPVEPAALAPKLRLLDSDGKPVQVLLETEYPTEVLGFRSDPVAKRKEERKLRLIVEKGLTPSDGNVPLGEDFVAEIALGSSEKLAVRGVSGRAGERESTITLSFSSPVTAEAAERSVVVQPKVVYRAATDRNDIVLTGAFRPGQAYQVEIRAGLTAGDGATLAQEHRTEVKLANLEPVARFQSEGRFLTASGARTLALETINVNEVTVTVDRVYRNNLFTLFQYHRWQLGGGSYRGSTVPPALGDRLAEETLKLKGGVNQRVVTPLKLDRFLAGPNESKEPGFYRITASRAGDYSADQRWVLVTDLGMIAKRGRGDLSVWVSSFADLSAQAGARVTLLSDKNQTLGETSTDGSGVARFAAETFAGGEPYLLLAERGKDFSFLLFDQALVDTGGLDVGGDGAERSGFDAFLYGERDLYRPGETVEGVAVLRDARLGSPAGVPVSLERYDPDGQEVALGSFQTDGRGLVPFSFELPVHARTGQHRVDLEVAEQTVGSYWFQVEEFVPDRIKVEISPGTVGADRFLPFEVYSAYLFGPPASELPADARARLEAATFAPKGFEAFSFSFPERSFSPLEIFSESGDLDGSGRRTFRALLPSSLTPASSLEAVLTARVAERGGRGVTAQVRVPVHPYERYVGLRRTSEGYAEPGKEVELEWVSVAPAGSKAPSGALRAELYQDRWNTVLRRTEDGTFTYDTVRDPRLITTQALPAGSDGGRFRFTPREYGSYRVVLSDLGAGSAAQVSFYASGWGYSPWAIENPSRIELDLDRDDYAPGSTATLQVRAPFAGKLLLTVERDTVLKSEVHTLDGNTASISLPVEASWRPNVYVTATLIRAAKDLQPGMPGRAFGAIPLLIDRTDRKLAVDIKAPEEMRPGKSLEIEVRTAPGAAVTVAAVDEGILRLIGQETPDPFSHFYRKRALAVSTYDTFALLLPEIRAALAGGGEGLDRMAQFLAANSMRRPEPVAFWSGVLTAGSDGTARARFEVPDFQGSLRVMAVALDGERFGGHTSGVRVRDLVVALPTLPRFLQLGDALEVPVTVRNDTPKAGDFRVRVAWSGPGNTSGAQDATASVAQGAESTVYLPLSLGGQAGEVDFTVTAEGNGESTRSRGVVMVRPALPPKTSFASGVLTQATSELAIEGKLRPETVRRDLVLGPVPLVRLHARLRDLLEYPYGCLEQLTSKTFPLLYVGELAQQIDPALFEQGDPAYLVESGLAQIRDLQLPSGGFALWPDVNTAEPWGTLYATHLFVEAREAGHAVDGSALDSALSYLGQTVRTKAQYGADELDRVAYALYVLARADRGDVGTMDFLREKQQKALSKPARMLLAGAYAALGSPETIPQLIAGIEDADRVQRQTGGNLGSTLRDRALLLLALLDAAPGDARIPALAERIAREADTSGGWTTQESAFALVALGRLFAEQADKPPARGTVLVGDREVGRYEGETLVLRGLEGTAPIRIRLDGGYAAGSLYYSLSTRGVPEESSFKPSSEGLEIERSFFTRDGSKSDLANLKQGDLVVMKTRVRSVAGPVANVVVSNLLPPGLEIENPRLKSAETLPWVTDANLNPQQLDMRDDRVLAFTDLPADQWQVLYTVLRAVVPGTFRLPPPAVEAMYDPGLVAVGELGQVKVTTRK